MTFIMDLISLFSTFVNFVFSKVMILVSEQGSSSIDEFHLTEEQFNQINLLNELKLAREKKINLIYEQPPQEELTNLFNEIHLDQERRTNLMNEFQLAEEQVSRINLIHELQITQEQFDRIKMIERGYAEQIHQFEQRIKQSETELIKLITSPALSEQLRQKQHESELLKMQAAQVYFAKFLAVRDIFTLSQRQSIQNEYLPPPI